MAIKKENGLLLLLLAAGVFLAFRKPGKTVVVMPELPTDIPTNTDASFKVFVPSGTILYAMDKTTRKGRTMGDQYFDGYNTGELPTWVKIKNGNEFDYVQSPDFTITTSQTPGVMTPTQNPDGPPKVPIVGPTPTQQQLPGHININAPLPGNLPTSGPIIYPTPGQQQQPIYITLPSQHAEPLTDAPIVAPGHTLQQNLQSNMNTLQYAPDGARLIQPRF